MQGAYDAVVVGAGPAGLSAAAEITAEGGRCLLVEQGGEHVGRDRHAPAEILSGVGGAGLFSDGKHSFHPASTELWRLGDTRGLARAYARTCEVLARHGVVAPAFPEVLSSARPAEQGGTWEVKRYPSLYASLQERMHCIRDLYESIGELPWLSARVERARRVGGGFALEVEQRDTRRIVETRRLVVATGRLSPRWIRPWLEPLGVTFAFRRLEIGVRLETAASSPLFSRLDGVDPKLSLSLGPEGRGTRLLTFCTCRDGEVVVGSACNMHAVSGRADGPRSGRSSIGLLARITDEPLAREIEPSLFGASPAPFVAPLGRVLGGPAHRDPNMVATFGEAGALVLGSAIERFVGRYPELESDGVAVVHGPCIEGIGDYPVSDEHLELAPGVFVAGDACGRFRGIVASMISGRYVGARITA